MKYYVPTSSHGGMVQVAKFEDAYLKVSDHEAEVARLRAEICALKDDPSYETACETIRKLRAEVEKVRGYEVAPLEAKVSELRAEVEGLRVDAMRYRWLCEDHADAATRLRRNDLLEHFRIRSYSANSTAIDAAMGESA